ncbi:BMP family ABC transporter substrate-binding protein (plasmid) [Borrelia coriaceae]|uniref:BMP family ABC transporter substrate-binding protein n=1 Tax=Borrelia coriaceae TaxID=144 RepID=UPI00046CE5F8|nr:BMP family ABC transporter substrate-binding protein [Borrelia coriaceae]UPA17396.1 BMP family ABC transporter substrate-binding protein [Borrelia coriaceae]
MSKNLCFMFLFSLFFISCFFSRKSSTVINNQVVMGIISPRSFDTNGYFRNAFNGALNASNEFGIKLIPKVLTPYPVEGKRLMTFDEVLSEDIFALQKEGANFIWFVSSYFSDMAIRFAYENSDILYGIIDDFSREQAVFPKNLISIVFRVEEGAFLAGYLASKVSKSNRIGFVTGVNIPNVNRFLVGFRAGAFYENSKTRVILKRILKDRDEAVGEAVAKYMYLQDGVDVILPVVGPAVFGIFRVAKDLGPGHYVIGIDKEHSNFAPGHVIASVIKDVGKVISDCSSDIIKSRNFNVGGLIENGIKEGIVTLIKDPSIIGKDLFDVLTKIQVEIVNGELVIPSTDYELDLFKEKLKR